MSAVLVTGVGGPAGLSALKALREAGIGPLVGVDANPRAAGREFCDRFQVVPPARDPRYLEALWEVLQTADVTVLLPTVDEELLLLSAQRRAFALEGITLLTAPAPVLATALDKHATAHALGDPFVATWTLEEFPGGMPCVIKPRRGRGSRDVYVCEDAASLAFYAPRVPDAIVQPYLVGPEFTVDTLYLPDRAFLFSAARQRDGMRGGITTQGVIRQDPAVLDVVNAAISRLGVVGLSCTQVRFTPDGAPKIIEINPRVGGSSILTVLAGVNLPAMAVAAARGDAVPEAADLAVREIAFARFFAEVIVN